jgi:hypothetical protein
MNDMKLTKIANPNRFIECKFQMVEVHLENWNHCGQFNKCLAQTLPEPSNVLFEVILLN